MDQSLDGVDDLFGDPDGLDMALGQSTAVDDMLQQSNYTRPGLAQKLDELKLAGCSRKIAWSKLGMLAYVSKDGLKVFIRHIHCNKDDGRWKLSDEAPIAQVPQVHNGRPIVHLSFSESAPDLVLVDSGGRISIFATYTAVMNSFANTMAVNADSDDDAARPVGLAWCSPNREYLHYDAVRKDGSGGDPNGASWEYTSSKQSPSGILQPGSRPAFICVTKMGYLKVLFQQMDGHWTENISELIKVSYSDQLLTHASVVAAEGNGAIIVTHSMQGKINIFRLHIKWTHLVPDQMSSPANTRHITLVHPSIELTHVKTHSIHNVFHPQLNPHHHTDESDPSPPTRANVAYDLTHLHLLSTSTQKPFADACLFAIFSAAQHNGHLGDRKPCVLARWKLETTTTEPLHAGFDDVVHRGEEFPPQPIMNLRREDDIYFDRHVLEVYHNPTANTLSLFFDDGTISSYDLKTFLPAAEVSDPTSVASFVSAGFNFPPAPDALYCAFSGNFCLAIAMDVDHEVQLLYAKHDLIDGDEEPEDKELVSRIAVTMALAYARSYGLSHLSDDIIATAVNTFKHESTRLKFANEVHNALPSIWDLSDERNKEVLGNPHVPRCLSVQAALGFKSFYEVRELPALVPWITLNLRQISVIFSWVFRRTKKGNDIENYELSILRIIYGNSRYTLDLMKFIMNELLSLSDSLLALNGDVNAIIEKVKSMRSVSLCLILSSMPRVFLKYLATSVITIAAGYTNTSGLSVDAFRLCGKVTSLVEDSPLPMRHLDALIMQTESILKTAYASKEENIAAERELLISGTIPSTLHRAVILLLTDVLPKIARPVSPELKQMDRLALATFDYTCLGIIPDKRSRDFKRNRVSDILRREYAVMDYRRSPVEGALMIRRCTRCCETSTEPNGPRSQPVYGMWVTLQIMKFCFCGGMYVMEKADTPTPQTLGAK